MANPTATDTASKGGLGRYRKFIAALVGVTALMALRYLEIEFFGLDAVVLELVVSALTAAGVYQVTNEAG